jgi:hypothetical protein
MSNSLRDELLLARIEWPEGENRYFIPINNLNSLVTEDSVKGELRSIYPSLGPQELLSYSLTVCKNSKKIFALLVYNGKTKYICDFLNDGISDSNLPFVRSDESRVSSQQLMIRPYDLCTADHSKCLEKSHEACGIRARWHRGQ